MRSSRISYDLKDPPTHDRAIRELGEALVKAEGNVVHAAEALEVSHRALARWIATYPVLRQGLSELRELFGMAYGKRREDSED